MKYETFITWKKILAPFVVIFFAGFIGCYKWKSFINKLHNKAIEENRTNVWFAKKSFRLYFNIFLLGILNVISWSFLIKLLFFGLS